MRRVPAVRARVTAPGAGAETSHLAWVGHRVTQGGREDTLSLTHTILSYLILGRGVTSVSESTGFAKTLVSGGSFMTVSGGGVQITEHKLHPELPHSHFVAFRTVRKVSGHAP